MLCTYSWIIIFYKPLYISVFICCTFACINYFITFKSTSLVERFHYTTLIICYVPLYIATLYTVCICIFLCNCIFIFSLSPLSFINDVCTFNVNCMDSLGWNIHSKSTNQIRCHQTLNCYILLVVFYFVQITSSNITEILYNEILKWSPL